MKILSGYLTNAIITDGQKHILNTEECIGARFLKQTLLENGFDYSVVTWMDSSGTVGINNVFYNVEAMYLDRKFHMIGAFPTFWNRLFPKKIELIFEKFGS